MNNVFINIYINMANFYNTKNEITNTAFEFPCDYEEITLKGLKEGELLVSYSPSFIQNSNGILVGVDSRFNTFYILNSEKNVLKTLELNWSTRCNNDLLEVFEQKNIRNDYSIFILLSFIFIIIIIKILRRNHESN